VSAARAARDVLETLLMLDPHASVAAIVLDHSECAAVLARHRIDFCCKGKRPLADICHELGLDVGAVVGELEHAIRTRIAVPADPRTLSTRDLIGEIVSTHHRYLRRTLPFLQALASKVARVHGDREPLLRKVASTVDALSAMLLAHLGHEEHVVFPRMLATGAGELATLLRHNRAEHEQVGDLLTTLRDAAADYVVPSFGCNSYRTLMRELEELEADTFRHIHIENHVLLPRFGSEDADAA